jgi:hypothetical protein
MAKAMMSLLGGVTTTSKYETEVKDGRFVFAGKYIEGSKFGGVDSWGEIKPLQTIVERLLKKHECVICEGSKLHSCGPFLQDAIFKADKQIVLLCYASPIELNKRLMKRSGRGVTKEILQDQQACLRALNKWNEMGVKTLHINTEVLNPEDSAKYLLTQIKELWHTTQAHDGRMK